MLWRTFPPCTLVQKIGRGTSAVSVEFSRDPDQRFIYVVNQNHREVDVWITRPVRSYRRSATARGFSSRARLFDAIRAAVDSKGNVYVAEDEGRRLGNPRRSVRNPVSGAGGPHDRGADVAGDAGNVARRSCGHGVAPGSGLCRPPLRQFRLHHTEAEKNIEVLPHCMRLSNDGLVYVCDRLANRLQAFDKMGNFKRNIDIPWKNYTAENEDLRKYCHTAWRTFPPCTLVQKIGRGDFGGFGRFLAIRISGSFMSSTRTRGRSISWIAQQGRSCRRSATAPGFSSRANCSMPFVPPSISKAMSMWPRTKAAGSRDLKVVGP